MLRASFSVAKCSSSGTPPKKSDVFMFRIVESAHGAAQAQVGGGIYLPGGPAGIDQHAFVVEPAIVPLVRTRAFVGMVDIGRQANGQAGLVAIARCSGEGRG